MAGGKHLQPDRVERTHPASRRPILTADGFEANTVREAGEFLPEVRLHARQQNDPRGQVVGPVRGRRGQEMAAQDTTLAPAAPATAFRVLGAISFCHLLNDMLQSLIPAVYPILKNTYRLGYTEIGLITFTSSLTASLLQPVVGLYTDHRPTPWSLPAGMTLTMLGLFKRGSAGCWQR